MGPEAGTIFAKVTGIDAGPYDEEQADSSQSQMRFELGISCAS